MKPEPKKAQQKPEDFIALGIPKEWVMHIIEVGFSNTKELKEQKASKVHQLLNGYRKKNKLEIPALKIEEVEAWFL